MGSNLFPILIIHCSCFITPKDRTSLKCINLVKQSLILWCKCQSSQFSKFFYMLYDLSTLPQLSGFFTALFSVCIRVPGSTTHSHADPNIIWSYAWLFHKQLLACRMTHGNPFTFRAAHGRNPAQPSWRAHFIPHPYTLSRYSQVLTF